MSYKSLTVWLVALSLLLSTAAAMAQDTESNRVFKLARDSSSAENKLNLEDEAIRAWEPAITGGNLELSFGLGMLGLSQTLLDQKQVVYKYTDEATYWGDVVIKGQTAFNPMVRLGYSLNPWFTLEGTGGLSFCTYTSSISNRKSRRNELDAPVDFLEPALGEFDAEERSLITIQAGVNALVYPLNISGDGKGRWHPYLTAGAGRIWYDMNSNYTKGAVGALDLNFGGGIRMLADRNISMRIEVLFKRNSLGWDPAANFLELNEGTLVIPLNEYPIQADGSFVERPITSFESRDLNMLNYSIGFQGTF